MPIIRVELIEGRSVEQKREFVQAVTREATRILNCTPQSLNFVFVDVKPQDWGTDARLLSDPKD